MIKTMEPQINNSTDRLAALHNLQDVQLLAPGNYLSVLPAAMLSASTKAVQALKAGNSTIIQKLTSQHFTATFRTGQEPLLNIRIRMGELSEQEKEEWILRSSVTLAVPNGGLCLRRSELISDLPVNSDTISIHDEEFAMLPITSGFWRLEVFGYIPAQTACNAATGQGKLLPAWFRETRGTSGIPAWLLTQILKDPKADPGNEGYWGNIESELNRRYGHCWNLRVSQLAERYVHYVMAIKPVAGLDTDCAKNREGITSAWSLRSLGACPMGIRL